MTATRFSMLNKIGLTLGVALSVTSVASSPSLAYSARARDMCTGDAFRLCSSEIPNISRIAACMRRNKASLSAGCRAVMDEEDGTSARAKPVQPAPAEHRPAPAVAAKPQAPIAAKPVQAAPVAQKPAPASPVVPPVVTETRSPPPAPPAVTETKVVPTPSVEPGPAVASPESAAVAEVKPARSAPIEHKSVAARALEQPAVAVTNPVQAAPAEQAPVTPTYVERPSVIPAQPVQAAPVEQRPAIAAPVEARPVEARPADAKLASSGKPERQVLQKPRHRQTASGRNYRGDYGDIERAMGIALPLLMQFAW